jgi:uncharacterized membrane protein
VRRLAAAFIILIPLFFAIPANASELKIEPKNFQLQAIPGDTLVEDVLITNLSTSNKTLKLSWSTPKNNGIGFASFEKSVPVLSPNATNSIELEFKIPKDLQPADYYGSLVVKTDTSEEKADFVIRILGTTREEIRASNFTDSGGRLNFTVINSGNRTISLQTKATIEGLFGLFSTSKDAKSFVRAGEQKEISISHNNLPPGFYQADIVFLFGEKGMEHVFPSFWINSDFVLIVVLLLVIAIAFYLKSKNKAQK